MNYQEVFFFDYYKIKPLAWKPRNPHDFIKRWFVRRRSLTEQKASPSTEEGVVKNGKTEMANNAPSTIFI